MKKKSNPNKSQNPVLAAISIKDENMASKSHTGFNTKLLTFCIFVTCFYSFMKATKSNLSKLGLFLFHFQNTTYKSILGTHTKIIC